MNKQYTLGIVGVRGYVGKELLGLLAEHSSLKVDWVSSRQLAGKALSSLVEKDANFQFEGVSNEHYYHQIKVENLNAENIAARNVDIVVLALPNGLARPLVEKLESSAKCRVIIDLSADYRFNDDWSYSVPELTQFSTKIKATKIKATKIIKISNPGCYATAMQLGLAPLLGKFEEPANCFGISGYSGAGTKPSANNDPLNLENNIIPYGLIEHLHEKEVSYHLNCPVSFSPHVAAFFRGISMTIQLKLKRSWQQKDIFNLFNHFYQDKTQIKITASIPNLKQVINTNGCIIGGFSLSENGKRLTLVSCLDNLLKGAASQALQNICSALNLNTEKELL